MEVCFVWSEVCVRLCGSGSPQSTTAKRGHFVGHHGESVTQSVPPNLRALRKFLQKLSKVTNYGIMQISILLRARFVHRPFHKQKPQPNCSIEVFVGGRRWIRTTEVVDNRFTVCSLWPLGNPPMELVNGIEPSTC